MSTVQEGGVRHDPDEVFRRYQRRRELPFRQLRAAIDSEVERVIGPVVRWLVSKLA
jgi:hypothetical protein